MIGGQGNQELLSPVNIGRPRVLDRSLDTCRVTLRRLPGWVLLSKNPAIATHRVLAATTGYLYVFGGLLVLLTLLLSELDGARVAPMAGLAAFAVVTGLTTLRAGQGFPHWMYHLLVAMGTVIITALVVLAGGESLSLALGSLYVFVAIDCFFFFAWPSALLHLLGFEILSGVALHSVGVPFSHVVLQQGCWAVVAMVVGWLARAAAEADQDPLTSLMNRRGFERQFFGAMAKAHHDQSDLCLILIDIDHFKAVNDTAGHLQGDRLLRECALAWTDLLRPGQRLARYGGDEFALLLPDCPIGRAAHLADQLREALSPQLVTCSAGVAERQSADSSSMLFSRADVALYEAKSSGRAQTAVYGRPGHRGSEELDTAVRAGQMQLYFQPVVELRTGVEVGTEALVRWNHPERGLLLPGLFIPQAEQSGSIHLLGQWTMHEACQYAARQLGRVDPAWRMSVNVTMPELRRPDFPLQVRESLAEAGLPPSALTIEVTETTFDAAWSQVAECLHEIRKLGVLVAMDDFGTGYSTLSRLNRFAVDAIKIDQSFIRDIPAGDVDVPILQAIIAMSQALGLKTIAEGIETDHQVEVLRRLGCAQGQGYLFGRPSAALPQSDLAHR
jgi:diguanylate cyclase (GGDEF)-like protein